MKIKKVREGTTLLGKTFKAIADYYDQQYTVVKSDGKLMKVATPSRLLSKISDLDLVKVEVDDGQPTIIHKKN